MTSEWDGTDWAGTELLLSSEPLPSMADQLASALRRGFDPRRAWKTVSVRQALGVPAINRAVTLISSTAGMLSTEAYRNGSLMSQPPTLVQRPDPFEAPGTFYSMTCANFAKYGEYVWYIAALDSDGNPAALINVPLNELTVEDSGNRLLPRYRWGPIAGTRRSGANPSGRFVHRKYPLGEPFALRGEGPLQLCGAANSIAVESQQWAANFYGEGGYPSTVIKKAGMLDPTTRNDAMEPDPNGMSEADALRWQWITRPNNVPRVVDDSISIEHSEPSMAEAQALEARRFTNGDAAREFGIPGSLLEYQEPGSSLTYQNLEGEFTKLIRVCLAPIYLEPIEQDMSDLLTRSTTMRFSLKAFLRPDAKARWEIYQIAVAVLGQEEAARIARVEEGIDPGDVEFAPVPFAPPAAIPSTLPRFLSRPSTLGPIVTRDQVLAMRDRLEAAGRPAGYSSIASALHVSVATVRRRLSQDAA